MDWGGRDYTWDFGDQTATATGESVSHTYNKLGNFTVSLNIKDSKGNVASDTATIRVAELYSVDIIVIADETSSVLDGVKVRLNQDERTTDAYGRVNYMILPGDYELVVKRDPYKTVIRQLNISGSATIGVRMKKIDYSEIIKEVETQNQGAGVNAKTNTSGSPDSNTNTADNAGGSTDSNPLSSGDYNSYFSEIESAISIINGYDSEMQKLTEKLNLKYNLEKARQSLTMADRDLGILRDPRKQVSADEFKVRAAEISKNVNKTMDGVVKSFSISNSKEFVSYPTDKEIDLIARGYVNFTKVRFDRAKTDYYVRYVKGIQDSIQYNAVIKNAKMEYLSGRTEEITIFLVEISAEEPLSDKSLLVYLPKEVVKGAGDIVAITDYSVVAADPIIGFGLNDNRYLLFYVKGYVDPAVGKGVKFVLAQAPDKVEFTNKGIGITGSAIFSSISNIENPVVVIEVLAIVILLIVYLIYQFDLIAKIRILIVLRDKELEGITGHIRDIERLIEKNEAENSYMAYDDMIKVYNNLPEKARAKVEPKTKELYQRIVMMDINNQLNLAFAVLQDNKRDEARAGYKKVMELYKRLTEENRREIIERAKTLFERVSAG